MRPALLIALASALAGLPVFAAAQTPAASAASAISTDPATASGGVYHLDKKLSSVTLKLSHLGLSYYTLRFDSFDGSYSYDPENPAASRITVTLQAASIDTGDAAFSRQVADQALNAGRFATITFVSTAVHPGQGGKGEVVGGLTLNGVTRPVTLDVVYNGDVRSPSHEERMGFSAVAAIQRSAFGLTAYAPLAGDEVSVLIEAEFVK
jgi:polyisoprenoid-binding protein YceI